jgi:hypothetical protein
MICLKSKELMSALISIASVPRSAPLPLGQPMGFLQFVAILEFFSF